MLIAGWPAHPNQESRVAGNAVADCAKARKMDEESFLKDRGQRVIKVGCFGKAPKFFGDFRSLGREPEEIWEHAKSLVDATL